MHRVARLLGKNTKTLSELIAREMGKPVVEGGAEINKCVRVYELYPDQVEKFLKPEIVQAEASSSFILFQPLVWE